VDGGVIDCCIHHTWASPMEIIERMSRGWREYVARNTTREWSDYIRRHAGDEPGGPTGFSPLTPSHPYPHPDGDKLRGASASNPAALRREHMEPHGIERVLLCHDVAMLVPAAANFQISAEIVRCVNDWTIERWLGEDGFFGVALVANQVPEEAAAEIRRAGRHPRMVGVLMGANGLSKGFGHPAYWPVYEAASELEMTIVLHAGGEAIMDTPLATTAGGPAATYTDYRTLLPQAQMFHAMSLITNGVFERFPNLRVLMVGAGAAWLAPFLWRFDTEYHSMRVEAPAMKRLPSEYFREFFRIGAYPVDPAPSGERLVRYFEASRGMDDLLCFASGYPNRDTGTPEQVRSLLPGSWWPKVLRENAAGLFRWDPRTQAEREAGAAR
jgi:predicted TIM-barrel fold metal-dependent hydrolase